MDEIDKLRIRLGELCLPYLLPGGKPYDLVNNQEYKKILETMELLDPDFDEAGFIEDLTIKTLESKYEFPQSDYNTDPNTVYKHKPITVEEAERLMSEYPKALWSPWI